MNEKKLIIVSHCVLNQNSVIQGWARARGAFPIAAFLVQEGIGILQLPCPELLYKGILRPPLEYEDYNTEAYRTRCHQLLEPYVMQIKEYQQHDYTILCVMGIHNSPTCSISGQRGVLMEELFSMLEAENIFLPTVEIPESYDESCDLTEIQQHIQNLIEEKNL